MNETKIRHWFVSAWLWISIIINLCCVGLSTFEMIITEGKQDTVLLAIMLILFLIQLFGFTTVPLKWTNRSLK